MTILVLCVGLSSLSTLRNVNIQSLAVLLGDVTAFHSFITGRERERAMEIAPATILTISTFDSHLKNWFLIDLAFFLCWMLDVVMVRSTDLCRSQSKILHSIAKFIGYQLLFTNVSVKRFYSSNARTCRGISYIMGKVKVVCFKEDIQGTYDSGQIYCSLLLVFL